MNCLGNNCCDIYRNKKYCRAAEKKNENGTCDCNHARLLCEVQSCPMRDFCGDEERDKMIAFREMLAAVRGKQT